MNNITTNHNVLHSNLSFHTRSLSLAVGCATSVTGCPLPLILRINIEALGIRYLSFPCKIPANLPYNPRRGSRWPREPHRKTPPVFKHLCPWVPRSQAIVWAECMPGGRRHARGRDWGLQAIQLSLYRAGLAGQHCTRLPMTPLCRHTLVPSGFRPQGGR